MKKYYAIFREETRGSKYKDWGNSFCFFEVADDSKILRQWEVYKNGNLLVYDHDHLDDEHGGLALCRLNEFDQEINPVEVQLSDLEKFLQNFKILNQSN